jgi:uncharacterized OB-fold protein
MSVTAPATLADPRPTVVQEDGAYVLEGGRCTRCGHALAFALPLCPRCRGTVNRERFGPAGKIWSFTVVHVSTRPGGETPYTLGYVDLDGGPRLLVRLDRVPAGVGTQVQLSAPSAEGNPTAAVLA